MSSHRRSADGKRSSSSESGGGGGGGAGGGGGGGTVKILNSAYYREKFGSQSPEEYKSLRLTNIDPKVSGEDLRDFLERIFKRYGDMHTKIVRQTDPAERICYVNFDFSDDAREAKRRAGAKIQQLLGKKTRMDPANVVRDQGGKFLSRSFNGPPPPGGPAYDAYYGGARARSRSPPPPPPDQRYKRYDNYDRYPNKEPDRGRRRSPSYHRRSPPPTSPPPRPRPTWHYSGESDDDDDANASRTLFVGNLELDISTNELRRYFERYGTVEEIDIKTPHEAITAYAFVRFSDILSAREARKACSGEYLRDNRCKIGWGKPIFSRRLWVGGLGSDTSLAWLEKEFDRFGAIEKIDFVRGDNHAYVLFSSQEAAVEAWKKMKGLKMKNGVLENSIQVDFVDASLYDGSGGGGGPGGQARNGRPSSPRRQDSSDHYRRQAAASKSPRSSPVPKRRRPSISSSSGGDGGSPPPARQSRGGKTNANNQSASRSRRDSPPVKRPKEKIARSPSDGRKPVARSSKMSASPPPSMHPATKSAISSITAAAEFAAQTLNELYQLRSPIWTGVLVLKRSAYPLQLYKLAGDDDLVDAYMRNERGESAQLNVGQRLKLDQPRTGEILRVSASAMEHSAYLLAVPNPNLQLGDDVKLADLQSRPLKLLVKYFNEKDAAGVVNTSCCPANIGSDGTANQFPAKGVLYSFPKCTYADDFVATLCPKLTVWHNASDECLLLVLQKDTSKENKE